MNYKDNFFYTLKNMYKNQNEFYFRTIVCLIHASAQIDDQDTADQFGSDNWKGKIRIPNLYIIQGLI